MKIRNKKTGEVFESFKRGPIDLYFYPNEHKVGDDIERETYQSLAELNNEWEDYVPKEPLIKDEKIRKAVRTWAEANDITEVNVSSSGYELWGGIDEWCIHFGGNPFKDIKPLKYTIEELCGELQDDANMSL